VKKATSLQIARRMLAQKISTEVIEKVTKLSPEEIKAVEQK